MGLFRFLRRQLRTPRCPVDTEEKEWIERRFSWLLSHFENVSRRPTLVPTPEFFPHEFDGSDEAFSDLFERLCAFMMVDPGSVDVHVYDEERTPEFAGLPAHESEHEGAAGLYYSADTAGRFVLGIADSMFEKPPELVATICHELGHVHLLGHGKLSAEEPDHERVTDLLTIAFGAGIFTANTAFVFRQWQSSTHQGWSSSRLGYLSEPSIAYGLACYAWVRGEARPAWTRYLEPGITPLVEEALDYLEESGDCSLKRGR